MKQPDYKKHLFRYYKTKRHSFFRKMDRAVVRASAENIHQLRVDIKKTRTVFRLLELLFPKTVEAKKYVSVFKPVFKSAGEIREAQVNHKLIAKYSVPPDMINLYHHFLKASQKGYTTKLKKAIDGFRTNKLSISKIEKHSSKIKNKEVVSKIHLFISNEMLIVKKLSEKRGTVENIHKIRKRLKALHAIMSLLNKIREDKEADKLLILMKQCEDSIGNWHDGIGLIHSLEDFSESRKEQASSLKTVQNKIKKENRFLLKKIKSELKSIIAFLLPF